MIGNVERKQVDEGKKEEIYAHEFGMQWGKIGYLKKQQSMSLKKKISFRERNHTHL